jgi:hypothetical protein
MKNLPSGVDLTNGNQKIFAGFLIGLVLILLWYLLPPLIVILTNLWIAAAVGIPLLFLIWNYEVAWHWFKKASWELTKFSINKDKPGYLYKYHEYLVTKYQDMERRLAIVIGARKECSSKIRQLQEEISVEQDIATAAQKNNNKIVMGGAMRKAKLKSDLVDKLMPRMDLLHQQEKSLTEVLKLRIREAEELKQAIDAKIEEYETLKEIDAAIKAAGAGTDQSNSEYKAYRESLKQMESEVASYAANIELFDTKMKPLLDRAVIEQQAMDDAGLKILEEYKAQHNSPDFKRMAQPVVL